MQATTGCMLVCSSHISCGLGERGFPIDVAGALCLWHAPTGEAHPYPESRSPVAAPADLTDCIAARPQFLREILCLESSHLAHVSSFLARITAASTIHGPTGSSSGTAA